MFEIRRSVRAALAASLVTPLVGGIAVAQTAPVGGLEEITVTAQRREENLQQVPVAVSAFTASELERRNVTQALDLVQYIPNLNGNNNTGLGSANVYFLRGLGNTESIATFDPPVGTYVDDVYIARQNSNNFGMFDVERVEVLRGPQGTLFGRNTTGGAINLLLHKPGDELRGLVEVGFGSYSEKRARVSVDLPVNDRLSTQLAAYYLNSDGYVKNFTTGAEDNGKDEKGVRGAIRLRLGDDAVWNASVNYVYSGTFNKLSFECGTLAAPGTPPGGCSGRYNNSAFGSTSPPLQNAFITIPNPAGPGTVDVATTVANGKGNRDEGIDTNTLLVASNLEVPVADGTTLNFITGYMHLQQDYLYDFSEGRQGRSIGGVTVSALPTAPLLQRPLIIADAAGSLSPNGAFVLAQQSQGDQFSQEIKVSGTAAGGFLKYVGGVYFFREDYGTEVADVTTSFVAGAPTLAAQVPRPYVTRVAADRLIDNSTQSWAVYFQGDLQFTEAFTGTLGLRYTDETKTVGVTDLRDIRAVPIVAGVQRPDLRLETANLQRLGIPTRLGTSMLTPRVALNFHASDDVLLFASATRGFRSGGWNVRGTTAQLFTPFEPEKVWTYEAGAKSEWFDRRLRANVTFFHLKDEKFQSPSAFVDAVGLTQFITRNDADFVNDGAELELAAAPVEGLQLYASVGYQDAKYENVAPNTLNQQSECLALRAANQVFATRCAAGIVTAQGAIAEPVRVPKITASVGGSYDIRLPFAGLVLTPAVNVVHQGETETAAANLSFFIDANGVYNVDGDGGYVAGSRQEAYTLLNASVTLSQQDSRWRVIADCSNCTDESYTQSAISGYSFLNPPRTYSARVLFTF